MTVDAQPFRPNASSAAFLRTLVFGGLRSLVVLILSVGSAVAQDSVVRGFVTDASTGNALQGANVVLQDARGELQAAVTNSDGFYQTPRIAADTYVLQVSFVGYQTHRDTLLITPGVRTYSIGLTPVAEELGEVTVEAGRAVEEAEAGLRTIRSADLERIPTPGPDGDLASFLGSVPGVVSVGDRGGQLYIRGGTPSQNLTLVDGLPVHKPFHIIGFYSAFPTDLVSSADFYSGGYGARYMGRISSVLDVNLRAGNANQYEGRAGVGPFTASLRAEGPIREGHTSFLTYFRQSHIEQTAPVFLGTDAPYFFNDMTAKVHTRAENGACSFVGMRTYDRGRIDPERESSFRWTNNMLGVRCMAFSPGSADLYDIRTGLTQFGNVVITEDGSERSARTWRLYSALSAEIPLRWGEGEWGVWAQADQYYIDLTEPYLGVSGSDEFYVTAGGHVGTTWRPMSNLSMNATVGLQVPTSGPSPSIEPRLRLSWEPGIAGHTNITAAVGIYRQADEGITDERDAGSAFVAWVPVMDRLPQARHYLLGWNQMLLPGLTAHVEGYYKQLRDIPVPKWTAIVRFNTLLALADGTAYGMDARLEFQRGPVYANINYGWNFVEYRAAEDDLGSWIGGDLFVYHPPHDQRHMVGVLASVDVGLFEASVRWQLSTGLPYTSAYGYDSFLELRGLRDRPDERIGIPRMFYAEPYSERLPAYHRLDISAERTFALSPRWELTAEAGAMNAYDRANLFYIDIYTLSRVDQLPLVPYVAFSASVR